MKVWFLSGGTAIPRVRWNGKNWVDSVGSVFDEMRDTLGVKRRGVGFYALRHTFETIAGDTKDQVAVDAIMGHSRGDMASIYRERIDDARLRAVVNHAHDWLYPVIAEKAKSK